MRRDYRTISAQRLDAGHERVAQWHDGSGEFLGDKFNAESGGGFEHGHEYRDANRNVGGSTVINITSLPLITAYPTTYHLIAGTTANGAMNFTLGTLPTTSPPLTGSLSISGGSVDFVLTGGPPPVHVLSWNGLNGGLPDGTWDVGTT